MLEAVRPSNTITFPFRPPNRGRMWADLALTIRQAAAITGVSERQIQHWLNRGYLPVSKEGNRRVSGNALELIVVIQQARQAGYPLRTAVSLSKEYVAKVDAGPLRRVDAGSEALSDLEEKLTAAISAIEAVRGVIQELNQGAASKTA